MDRAWNLRASNSKAAIFRKHYKRSMEAHKINMLIIENLYLDANKDARVERLQKIREFDNEALQSVKNKDCVQEVFKGAVTKFDNSATTEKMAESSGSKLDKSLHNCMRQIKCLLRFIIGSREGNFRLYLVSAEKLVKYFFAHDLQKKPLDSLLCCRNVQAGKGESCNMNSTN